jgi:hypothetical protein
VPLSAEEVEVSEVAAEVESAPPESLPVPQAGLAADFLTLEESSVFSEPYVPEETTDSESPISQPPKADYERSE